MNGVSTYKNLVIGFWHVPNPVNKTIVFVETKRDCREWKNIEKAAKSQTKTAVPSVMLDSIKLPDIGLLHLQIRDIVQHLI